MKVTQHNAVLKPGALAPWFHGQEVGGNPRYAFHSVGGRDVVLLFFGAASNERAAAALRQVAAREANFDGVSLCFFGVTVDPRDVTEARLPGRSAGIRYFLDDDRGISRAYGAVEEEDDNGVAYHAHWVLLDRMLRVVATAALDQGESLLDLAVSRAASPPPDIAAPVLTLERVFEPALCRELIARYEAHGGTDSGFMVEENGRTVERSDPQHKKRRDYDVDDEQLRRAIVARIHDRLAPSIERAFQFRATRMERYIVACYDAAEGGHFRAHRDNTTKGTAHRRFAVTINLNTDDYDGGELTFPEFGPRLYRAPTGGAVVFSCSLLHQAQPVTRGKRYAFLPFLYDDAAATLREANIGFLGDGTAGYRA